MMARKRKEGRIAVGAGVGAGVGMGGSVPPVLQKTVNGCIRGARGKDVAANNMKEDGLFV
jgi:hypothetical protein